MKHLLGTDTLSREEAVAYLDSAREFARVADQKCRSFPRFARSPW
jgi:aspartate carbamoyltransferase (EC 2.1.3.2)